MSSTAASDPQLWLRGDIPVNAIVHAFLKLLQPRVSALALSSGPSGKDAVRSFAAYYFRAKPELDSALAHTLLYGSADGKLKGVLEHCGDTKLPLNELRTSARLCFELLLMLVDVSVNPEHGERLLAEFLQSASLTPKVLASMKFASHILHASENERECAFKLIFLVEESASQFKERRDWIGSSEAVSEYDAWIRARLDEANNAAAAEFEGAGALVDDKDREVFAWSMVPLEDCDAEDARASEALTDLINDEDNDKQSTNAVKDPLGLIKAKSMASKTSAHHSHGFQASKLIGKAATKKMKAIWNKIRDTEKRNDQQPASHIDIDTKHKDTASTALTAETDLLGTVVSRGSLSLERGDFSAVYFLSEIHTETTLEDLQRGLAHLQSSVKGRAAALQSLVSEHFGQYVQCLDTLDHLHELIQSELSERSSRANRIQQSIDELVGQCRALYQPTIDQHRDSEQIRATLAAIRSHAALLETPNVIGQLAKANRFDLVTREAKRIRSLRVDQQQSDPLIRELVSEAHIAIERVCQTLRAQLEDDARPLDAQLAALRHLRALDPRSQPAQLLVTAKLASARLSLNTTAIKFLNRITRVRHADTAPDALVASPVLGAQEREAVYDSEVASTGLHRTVKRLSRTLVTALQQLQTIGVAREDADSEAANPSETRIHVRAALVTLVTHFSNVIRVLLFDPMNGARSIAESAELPTVPPAAISGDSTSAVHLLPSVSAVLRCAQQLRELKLPHESLVPIRALRLEVAAWFIAARAANTEAALLAAGRETTFDVIAPADPRRAPLQSALKAVGYGAQHITALPLLAHSIDSSLIDALSSLPGVRAPWLVKLIVPRLMDALRHVADAAHARLRHAAGLEDRTDESSHARILCMADIHVLQHAVFPAMLARILHAMPDTVHALLRSVFESQLAPLLRSLAALALESWLRHAALDLESEMSVAFGHSGFQWREWKASAVAPLEPRPAMLAALYRVSRHHATLFAILPTAIPRALTALKPLMLAAYLSNIRAVESMSADACQLCLLELTVAWEMLGAQFDTDAAEAVREEATFLLEERALLLRGSDDGNTEYLAAMHARCAEQAAAAKHATRLNTLGLSDSTVGDNE